MTDTTTTNQDAPLRHLSAARTRLQSALDALHAKGLQAPPAALATLSDLDAAAACLSRQTSQDARASIAISITPADTRIGPAGKLADAEIQFLLGPLAGSKLIGFGIWARRTGSGHNVTFPARTYQVNGERRSFALLRPADALTTGQERSSQERIRDLILDAYAEHLETGVTRTDYTDAGTRMSIAGTVQQHAHTTQDASQDASAPAAPTSAGPRYDYTNQAWIDADGRYLNCGHPDGMPCGCYGRAHAGEVATQDAQPLARDWTAKHLDGISAADRQEASSSPTPDPGVLMRAAPTPSTPAAPRTRRF
jgi:hypothetical protein